MSASTTVRWGMTVPFAGVPLSQHPDLYRRIEALGYDDIWSAETPNGADGFTTLAQAAPVTERVRLVTGIVNPFTRGPSVLAQTAAALQEASGGRFALGIGASSNVVVERFNGLEFAKPLSRVREAVERLRPVLSVPSEKGFGGLRLERPVTEKVPIIVAALRKRMLGLAGAIADGAFTNFLPISGLPAVKAAHRAGEAAGSWPEDSTELACRFFVIPGDPEESGRLARALFSQYGSVPVYSAFYRWLGWGERLDPMIEAYAAGDRQRAIELAPQELVEEIFLFGAPETIKERLQAFTDGGITTAVLAPLCPPDQVASVIEALVAVTASARPRCYVASPLGFTAAGRHWYAEVYLPALSSVIEPVDPWALTDEQEVVAAIAAGREAELWREIGARNIAAIRSAQLLVALLDGQEIDSGTASEVGFAAGLGLRCFGLRTDLRQTGEAGSIVNLQVQAFVESSGGTIAASLDELVSALTAAGR